VGKHTAMGKTQRVEAAPEKSEEESGTDSDEVPLAQRRSQKVSAPHGKPCDDDAASPVAKENPKEKLRRWAAVQAEPSRAMLRGKICLLEAPMRKYLCESVDEDDWFDILSMPDANEALSRAMNVTPTSQVKGGQGAKEVDRKSKTFGGCTRLHVSFMVNDIVHFVFSVGCPANTG
jgi:hypothetical protein